VVALIKQQHKAKKAAYRVKTGPEGKAVKNAKGIMWRLNTPTEEAFYSHVKHRLSEKKALMKSAKAALLDFYVVRTMNLPLEGEDIRLQAELEKLEHYNVLIKGAGTFTGRFG